MKRRAYIYGNWKMYKTAKEAVDYMTQLIPLVEKVSLNVTISLAVPFTSIESANRVLKGSLIHIGVQNISEHQEGAFTGEISAKMVKEAGAQFVLVGHSERRKLFHEDNRMIKKKIKRALSEGLQVVLCIGETEEEREQNLTKKVLETQLDGGLKGLSLKDFDRVILAYEPVWAIGTGKTATPAIAQESHHICRDFIGQHWGEEIAEKAPILYGGSVKVDTVKDLLSEKDIDGALVGGASLDVASFSQIIKNAESVVS